MAANDDELGWVARIQALEPRVGTCSILPVGGWIMGQLTAHGKEWSLNGKPTVK